MSLTVEDLSTIVKMPAESDVSLQTIAEFYEQYICNRIFHYHLRYDKQRDVKLRFKTSNLPHLLGIHNFNLGSECKRGFSGLISGDITLEKLKKANEGEYEGVLYRILYFPFVAQLMYNASALVFWPQQNRSRINAEFMFHDKYDERHIHLAARKEESKSKAPADIFYAPVTFVERASVYLGKSIKVDSIHVYNEKLTDNMVGDTLGNVFLESAADDEQKPRFNAEPEKEQGPE